MIPNLIIVGSPGSGKGTYSEAFQTLGYQHLGMGDLLRREVNSGSFLGNALREYVDGGKLIPDDLAVSIGIQAVISEIHRDHAFVLEGFPSTVKQFESFVTQLASLEKKKTIIVLHLDCDDEIAAERIAARLICSQCASIYNTDTRPPLREKVCDNCQGNLCRRTEDTYETALKRIQTYRGKTMPIVEYARQHFKVIEINANGPLGDILRSAESIYRSLE